MKVKQHATKQQQGQRRNFLKDQKIHKDNENDNITYQNFWGAAKAVIRGKLISFQAYLKKQEISPVN